LLAGILSELKPGWICVPGSTQGLDFGPGLAVKLGAACISTVERVLERDGHPVFVRPVFSGKIVAEVSAQSPGVLIVQPGSFMEHSHSGDAKGSLKIRTIDWKATRSRVLDCRADEPVDAALNEASVIVAAGRGIGKKENLELIERVAALFAKAAIAGSRPLCDLGWLPYRQQVGQTGATVAPDLYIACGISGAQQHLIGMRGTRCIVAINTDPEAAIFRHADIGIVEDAQTFLAELIQQAEESYRP
jgi:electron transfer flavoprotein alpha subunit